MLLTNASYIHGLAGICGSDAVGNFEQRSCAHRRLHACARTERPSRPRNEKNSCSLGGGFSWSSGFHAKFLARRRSPKSLQHSRSRCCTRGRVRPNTTDPNPHSTKARLFKLSCFFVAAVARRRPIQRAIMAGDLRTGIDLMRMDAGLDTGPIAMREVVPVRPDETAGDLTSRLAALAAKMALHALQSMEASLLEFHEQPTIGACYARKIDKSETEIDWTQSAETVRNHIHALSPAPGAFSKVVIGNKAENIKLFRAEATTGAAAPGMLLCEDMRIACGTGAIRVLLGQRSGKTVMSGRELMRGATLAPGAIFTQSRWPSFVSQSRV